MTKIDRRILKSEEAIKKSVIELMSEENFNEITIQDISDRANVSRGTIYLHYKDKFDLLDKLIEEHISKLSILCRSASELSFIESTLIWFQYFESNYLFFSTMLASKGAPSFRSRFLDLLIDELRDYVNVSEGTNYGLSQDIILQFLGSSYVGVVEWWFINGMPHPPKVMAEQVGVLLERNI